MSTDLVKTFDELCAWIKQSFEMIIGTPRAWMEFPVKDDDGNWVIHREVYVVLGIAAMGERSKWEAPLVQAMQTTLRSARFDAIRATGAVWHEEDARPVMFVRRMPEFITENGRMQVTLRCTVPGCDLTRIGSYTPNGIHPYYLGQEKTHAS